MTTLDPVLFGVGALGVWRLSHLLHAEDGPLDLFRSLRRAAGRGVLGRMLGCFYCVSLWVAIPFALLVAEGWPARVLAWPALSGAAILTHRLLNPPASWVESPPPEEEPPERSP